MVLGTLRLRSTVVKYALIALLLIAGGCSWKAYDKINPDDYHRYWQDDNNK